LGKGYSVSKKSVRVVAWIRPEVMVHVATELRIMVIRMMVRVRAGVMAGAGVRVRNSILGSRLGD